MKEYDLIVVGSGAGLTVLNAGLEEGLRCALVENGKMGGTCLTRGCIPSKVLTCAADALRMAEHAQKIGIRFQVQNLDWDTIASRMWSQIDESRDIDSGLKGIRQLTVYRGTGEFTAERAMKVKLPDGSFSGEFRGDKIVLASGGRSQIPPIQGIEETGFVTTESFFGEKFPRAPWKSLILVGGGIIAAEFAHVFSALGTSVTIVEMLPRILHSEEPEISRAVEKNFKKRMTVLTDHTAVSARSDGNNKRLTARENATGTMKELEADEIFICAGRRCNADLLKAERCGIETYGPGEWIKTNEYCETSVPDVWAIGDANGKFQFRHKANAEAELLIRNLFGNPVIKTPMDYSAVPWVIFTDPQVGHVGMTEQQAVGEGHSVYRAVRRYSSVAKGFAMGYNEGDDDDGFVKLVIDRSMRILGAHAVGPHAEMLVQPFVYLMNAGFTCEIKPRRKPHGTASEETSPHAKQDFACPGAGSVMPIYRSMVVHPSLNEVAGWALSSLEPVNIHHHHDDSDGHA